jgi:hypothetical protein
MMHCAKIRFQFNKKNGLNLSLMEINFVCYA